MGCVTFLIGLGAFLLGYWLDRQLGTGPWLMILCFVGSSPIVFVLIYYLVKAGTTQLAQKPARDLQTSKEETHRESD